MANGRIEDENVKVAPAVCATNVAVVDFLSTVTERTSSWSKLIRIMCYVRRFVHNVKNCVKRKRGEESQPLLNNWLTTAEVQGSENCIWRLVQERAFPRELSKLSKNPPESTSPNSVLVKITPFVQDGLLRVGGRLSRAKLEYEFKHPIILPSNSREVLLYVKSRHHTLGHCGVSHLVADLRRHLWILKVTTIARNEVRNCLTCKKIDARPQTQAMSDLPRDRVTVGEPPFTHVGVDCFGPYLIRRGRSDVKRYGLIITCLVTRAVHIEVLESLETDSFLNGFRRFIARRGSVRFVRSDNGTNFVGAERELHEEIEVERDR